MTKTQEELNVLKEEVETESKFHELTDEDLAQVFGGVGPNIYAQPGDSWDKKDIESMFIGEQGEENMNINKDPQSLNEQFKEKAKVVDLTHY